MLKRACLLAGQFLHRSYRNKNPNRMWLHHISYASGRMVHPDPCHQPAPVDFDAVWTACNELLSQIKVGLARHVP